MPLKAVDLTLKAGALREVLKAEVLRRRAEAIVCGGVGARAEVEKIVKEGHAEKKSSSIPAQQHRA
jgi:hypothetical protein